MNRKPLLINASGEQKRPVVISKVNILALEYFQYSCSYFSGQIKCQYFYLIWTCNYVSKINILALGYSPSNIEGCDPGYIRTSCYYVLRPCETAMFSIYSELHSLNKKATKIKEQSIWNILNDYMMYNGFTFEMTLQYNFTSWTYFDTIDSADQCNGSGDQFNYFYVLFGWIFLRRKYYLKVQPNVAGSNMTATENRIKQGVIAQINGQKARKYELMEHFLLLCALSAHIYAHLYIIV